MKHSHSAATVAQRNQIKSAKEGNFRPVQLADVLQFVEIPIDLCLTADHADFTDWILELPTICLWPAKGRRPHNNYPLTEADE